MHVTTSKKSNALTPIYCNKQKAQKYGKTLEKRRGELATAEQSLNVTDDEEIQLKNQLSELTEEAAKAADTKTLLQDEMKVAEGPIKQKERNRQVLARELAQAKKAHKNAQRRLEHARKQILESQGNAAEEERARTRKIATTEADLARAKERMDPLKAQVGKHLHDYQEVEPALAQMKETREGTEKQVYAVQQKVKAMQAESGEGRQALAVFGSKCKPLYEVSRFTVLRNPTPHSTGSHLCSRHPFFSLIIHCLSNRLSRRRSRPISSRDQSPAPWACT